MSLLKDEFGLFWDRLTEKAEETMKTQVRDDDYIDPEDGLIRCGLCHAPRQCKVSFMGREMIQPVMCDCRVKELAEEEAERRRERIEFLRKDGFDDPMMEKSRFANDDAPDSEMSVICRNYVKKFDEYYERGKGLLLSGGVGTGKTFYASCIANALIEDLHPCLVTSIGRYIRGMESSEYGGMNEKIDYLRRFSLVVFDDLGVERNTPYMNELVYAIIDGRIRSGKPMIVTTNIDIKTMGSATAIEQARIYDRVLSACVPIAFTGDNIRRMKARNEYRDDLRELKGEQG